MLNSYFNLKKANKNKKVKLDLYKFSFINLINKAYIYNLIKTQVFNLNNKRRILRWKLRKNSYINWINKRKNLVTKKSLKRLFISFPYIKHTNNNINLLVFVFNKNKAVLKNKINKLNILLLKRNLVHNNVNVFQYSDNTNIFNLKDSITRLIKYKKISFIFKRNFLANIYLNNFKFNKLNLINLKNIIYKIYNKKVNINIINLRYLYLENNILVDALTRKLNDRKKRVLRVLKKTLKLAKLATFVNYVKLNMNINKNMFNDILNIDKKDIYRNIISNLNNKHMIGMFLEAKGRLTRRMTASRAVYKLKYKGNMKDAHLNEDNKFTILKKGYLKSNIVHSTNNSYNKNGSFGISSKVNTY